MVGNTHKEQSYGKCHRDNTNPPQRRVKGEKYSDVFVDLGYPFDEDY